MNMSNVLWQKFYDSFMLSRGANERTTIDEECEAKRVGIRFEAHFQALFLSSRENTLRRIKHSPWGCKVLSRGAQ